MNFRERLVKAWRAALLPPEKRTISQWADEERVLSAEASAEPGKWDTSRAEYQRGIMEAIADSSIEVVVCMKSSQVGWSEILANAIGFDMDEDPCPILVLQPTLDMAEAWSQDRLMPMLRDTPCLSRKFKQNARNASNTMLHKAFPGGHLTVIGANAPAGLASRPIRKVYCDEVDRYPASAGAEGDPITLAWKRTTTFFNRKMLIGGTPTLFRQSRVAEAFEETDKRHYFVPCPECGEFQTLKWSNIVWPKGEREKAHYACEHCGVWIEEKQKHWMILNGEWRATAPFTGKAGFFIWEAYSPWSTWARIAIAHKEAQGNVNRMKTWTNTVLGEVFKDAMEEVDSSSLLSHREKYQAQVPKGVLVLTAGIDVQKDRLEVEIVGWGEGEESWSIEYRVIYGSPEEPDVWNRLDLLWQERFTHETGAKMLIDAACIDSGFATIQVYNYCKDKRSRRVFCIKGRSGPGLPAVSAPSKKQTGRNRRPVFLYTLGVDSLKSMTHASLRIQEAGPGYCHFPMDYDYRYFDGLTSEALTEKLERGYARDVWIKKAGTNNEPFDCRNYAKAALILLNPPLKQMSINYQESGVVRVAQPRKTRTYRSRGIQYA
jgi:phage terminase large subunit GpA-like protein